MKETGDKLLKGVLSAAREAGALIMEVYESGDFETTSKNDDSPLTRADTGSHRIIVERLRELTPEIPILSEESTEIEYSNRAEWDRFWLVDPLDGTKEFVKRDSKGEFTVNIALIEDNVPVLGVVTAPALGSAYYGTKFAGAFKSQGGGEAERIKAADFSGGCPRVVASKSHRGPILDRFLEKVGDHECVSMGSSLKICLVAEGKADIYPRLGPTMEWDTAAAQAVLTAAGGALTDLNDSPLIYNKEDLHNPYFIAAGKTPFPWQEIINEIETEEKKI